MGAIDGQPVIGTILKRFVNRLLGAAWYLKEVNRNPGGRD